jgi:hypothetical protein
MSQTINVLFLAAEAEPFVKVGGLGDVAGTLPRAVRRLSDDDLKIDVRLVLWPIVAAIAPRFHPWLVLQRYLNTGKGKKLIGQTSQRKNVLDQSRQIRVRMNLQRQRFIQTRDADFVSQVSRVCNVIGKHT